MVRKIAVYFFLLFIWLIPTIFSFNEGFYNSLSLPSIILSNNLIAFIWTIILIINGTLSYILIKDYDLNDDYLFIIILYYFSLISFPLLFFIVNNLLLSLISVIITAVTSYFFLLETKKINNNLYLLLIPNLIWNLYNLIIMIITYLLN